MADPVPPPERPLNSWKEIAAHFGRDVRTVQRWEKEEGMPVHRHPHRAKSSVFAYAHELDAWWKGVGESRVAEPSSALDPVTSVAPADVSAPQLSVGTGKPPTAMRWWVVAAGTVGILVIVGLRWDSQASPPRPVVEWSVHANAVGPVTGDLNGDGRPELVSSAVAGAIRIFEVPAPALTGSLRLIGEIRHPYFQATAGRIADFNDDGLDDLLISAYAPADPKLPLVTEPTFLVFGRREWPRSLQLPDDADTRLELPPGNDARMGNCLRHRHADLNGDAIDDVLLGGADYIAPGRPSAGAIFVVFGRATWPRIIPLETGADVTIWGSRSGEGLSSPCVVGDEDGDGRPDLAIVARESTLWGLRELRGRVYLIRGRATWPRVIDTGQTYDLRIDGDIPGNHAPELALADVNGDRLDDIVYSRSLFEAASGRAGEVLVWFGGRRKDIVSMTSHDVRIDGLPAESLLGNLLHGADVDEDGFADLLMLAAGSGEVWLLRGRAAWPGHLRLPDAGRRAMSIGEPGGRDQLTLVDLDGDSMEEVLVASQPSANRATRIFSAPLAEPLTFALRPGFDKKFVLIPGPVVVRVPGSTAKIATLDPKSFTLNASPVEDFKIGDEDGDGQPDLQLYFETGRMKRSPPGGPGFHPTAQGPRGGGPGFARLIGWTRDGRMVGGVTPIQVIERTSGHDK